MNTITYAHIALVEDDEELASLTSTFLTKEGYQISHFSTGDEALEHIPKLQPDCVLLDIMLPGVDGVEVCRNLRTHYQGPIIFLTAKGDQLDEILGLEVGGDDYLSKPVEPRLLLAHIRAQLRRKNRKSLSTPSLVEFEINESSQTILFRSQAMILSQPEFQLLKLMLQSNGGVISRDQVMLGIRGIEHDGYSRTVDILVSDLRKKLHDPEWIKTIRGKGYLWQG